MGYKLVVDIGRKLKLPSSALYSPEMSSDIEGLVEVLTFFCLAARNMCVTVTSAKRHENKTAAAKDGL